MPSSRRVRKGVRLLVWTSLSSVVAADALAATPIGLPLLGFVPVALAAWNFRLAEAPGVVALAAVGRVLFGPVGAPYHSLTLVVPAVTQQVFNALVSTASYAAVLLLVRVIARQREDVLALRSQAHTDPLTGAANRRALELYLSLHQGTDASVLVVDADHFKSINDSHGHEAGDRVLVELVRRVQQTVRAVDLVARTGGEEFVVVLVGCPAAPGMKLAERVAEAVRASAFDLGEASVAVTVSVGLATGVLDAALVTAADEAVYRAKHSGRDRVVQA